MLLTEHDWNGEWMQLQANRSYDDSPSYWDKRAPSFATKAGTSHYASEFLEYAQIAPGATVLDFGCGAGTLSLPLARQGHQVTSADFSPAMLSLLEQQAAKEGLSSIRTVRASWDDDWEAAGVGQADVAIASRSIAVADLGSALRKLNAAARYRVCLTLAAGGSPRHDSRIFAAIGREFPTDLGYVYAMNILFQMGIRPELRFIESTKPEFFATREDARRVVSDMLSDVSLREEELLERYLAEHLVPGVDRKGESCWEWAEPRIVIWAFISWRQERSSRAISSCCGRDEQ
ncbi:MAG: methyltransferase domain-containing protein [Coriobacteriia bacterium]|nr:methyltransferase domain-containing protein [Coriobacteriia bacterium]